LRGDDVLLVAYNGERWKDGFDLPFLRTRLAATDVEWPFRDMPYADLLPVVTRRFNVTVDGEDRSTLPGAYEALVDGDLNDRDPFDDSSAAVTAFAEGRYADLVTHNVVDVLRTGELAAVTRRYCSKSDFSLKSLTPTIHDT
jgi:DNA polymerase III epsilon subunit-like protein